MLVKSLLILVMRKGEELKAPRHASAAATRDIFPTLIFTYINNILIIGKDKAKIKALKKSLIRRFKIEDLGPIEYFIGVKIT